MPRDKEYLEKLIELLESDKRAVLLYIAFELALPVLTIKDLAIGQSVLSSTDSGMLAAKVILLVSLGLLCLAALFHFSYWRRIHLNAFAVARILLDGTGEQARELVFNESTGIWARHGWKYVAGQAALALGIVAYVAFFGIAIF